MVYVLVYDGLLFPSLQMGAYHTIDLQMNQKFTLAKPVWDVIALDRLGTHTVVSAAVLYVMYVLSASCCS